MTILLELNYCIKTHPTIDKNLFIKKYNFPKNFHFSDEDTHNLINNSKVVISGISSICMESICLGKPTIIIEKDKCLNFDPVPKFIDNILFKRANNYKELSKHIKFYLNLNDKEKELIVKKSYNIKNYYFEKPTTINKKEMLGLN